MRLRRPANIVTEMWNKTNEWNSPKNIRKRPQEAGYNPYLGMDSSNVGTAQGAGSSQDRKSVG